MQRRTFCKTLLAATGLASVVRGAEANLRLGMIGLGRRGLGVHLPALNRLSGVTVAEICDVDRVRLTAASRLFENARMQGDFRMMLDNPNLDAVVISVPQHWQEIIALAAVRAGKDILCEAPFAFSAAGGRAVIREAERCGRIVAVMSENHTSAVCRTVCERIRDGIIGAVKTVEASLPPPDAELYKEKIVFGAPPEDLNYDLWCGPAPKVNYADARIRHHDLIRVHALGVCGLQSDWIAFALRCCPFKGLVRAEGTGKRPNHPLYDVWTDFNLTFSYEDGGTLRVGTGKPGVKFIGERGEISVGEDHRVSCADKTALLAPRRPEEFVSEEMPDGNHAAFVRSIRTRRRPVYDGRSAEQVALPAILGNFCLDYGTAVEWDYLKGRSRSDEVNRLLHRTLRLY